MNPQVENAIKAIAAFATDEPWLERMCEVRRLLELIRDHSAGIDPEVVKLLKEALDPNLTPKEQEKEFVQMIWTIIMMVRSY